MNKNLQKYVDRYNRQRLTIGLLSLGIGLVIAVCNERYAYNALFGPFPITGQELAQIKDIYKSRKYFFIVQGRGLIDSGIGWVRGQTQPYRQEHSNLRPQQTFCNY
jgi:hypothetical protein